MISALHVVLLLSSAVLHAFAQTTVTLLGLSASIAPSQTPSIVEPTIVESFTVESIVPIGTNTAGETTYVEVLVIDSQVLIFPSQTLTEISAPTTITETFVEDASGRTGGIPIIPGTSKAPESCGFGADGRGTCVISLDVANLTFSGDVVPIYTLTEPSPSSTASQSTSSHNGAMSHRALAVGNVLAVVAAVVLVHL
ncbi:hypothetical protein MSAN_01986000 [Mycena sanguinolenta]|uniref:Uncharacterized protein n=1 Tax=Mycena sanguinolenta TaxID=230812 RepID=A0A8H6XNE7_9AGAR|nr:hypothetical protein MSAN_01986000 [Mycena sanguinolenta]